MWRVVPHRDGKDAEVTFLSNLRRHTNTVNCVRFSPDGLLHLNILIKDLYPSETLLKVC